VDANWLPGVGNPGAIDTAVFGDLGTSFDAVTVNNVVSVDTTVSALNYTNTTADPTTPWHVTEIPAGVTLTVTNLTVGLGASTPSVGLKTLAAFTGGGTLIGYGTLTAGNTATSGGNPGTALDLSGLSTFIWSNSATAFNIGIQNRSAVDWKLAYSSNHVTAATINLNTTSSGSSAFGTVTLGAGTNVLNAGAINAALSRNSCDILFAGASGGLRIRGSAGDDASRADMTLGNRTSGGNPTATGQLLLNGHPVDIMLDDLTLGRLESGNAGSSGVGVISFDTGTVDVTTVNLASASISIAVTANGTINVGAGGTLIADTISMANVTGSAAGNGTINVNGGTLICSNSITKANTGGVGTLTLNGGSLMLISGTIGTPDIPIDTMNLSDATLMLDAASGVTNVAVTSLVTGSTTNNTINISSVPVLTGYPTQLPLISYGSLNNNDFVLGTLPGTYTGYLSNNIALSRIDLVISGGPAVAQVLTWNGNVNADWDTSTPNWRYGVASATYVSGDLVTFNDAATGLTTVNLTTSLTPNGLTVNNNAKSYTFNGSGSIDGTVGLTKDGPGQLTIANSGVNTFSGGVSILGGTVRISGSDDRLPTDATVTLADVAGATLDLNNLNQTIQGLEGGGLVGGNVSMGSGSLSVWGGGTFGGVISGTGQLIKTNLTTGGTLTLTNANTYSGGTIVGGFTGNTTLQVENATGSGTGSGFVRVLTNGTFSIGTGGAGGSVAAGVITNDSIVRVNRSDEMLFTNVVVGTGALEVEGGGTVVINGTNGYTGGTVIDGAKLLISNPGAVGSGLVFADNSNPAVLQLSNNITLANPLQLGGKPGSAGNVPNIENVSGTNTLTGPILMTANGAIGWGVYATAGHLIVSGSTIGVLPSQTSQNRSRILNLRGDATGEWSGGIHDTVNSVTNVQVLKDDAGTWTLSGSNSYSGPTTINNGTLLVNGILAGPGTNTVNAGTLGGTGVILGPVTTITGTLSPGTSLGTLTISNNVTLFGNTIMEVSHAAYDQVRGMNTLEMYGTLEVVVVGTLTGGEVFKLFDAASYVGSFSYLLPTLPAPLAWDDSTLATDGTLRVTGGAPPQPEIDPVYPSGTNLVVSVPTVLGPNYVLQTTTNLTAPVIWQNQSTNAGTGGSVQFDVPIEPGKPQKFVRIWVY
jgi:autotransporter-associated beta strand protein